MKYTKGPWYYSLSAGGHQGLVASETTGKTIALTYDTNNAQLIAAAPDLLEAAQEAEDMFAQYGEMYGFTEMAPHCWGAIECLREAIRRATE
jgi:hypothetical protein